MSQLKNARTWAAHLIQFYQSLSPIPLPHGIQWLHPQQQPEVQKIMAAFFNKFYNDQQERSILLGINPGRYGAGITAVNFTAARQLTEHCGITHSFKNSSELSAEFIYDLITAYGGPAAFYKNFFIGSVCPLGFVQNGRNLNYYDDKDLQQAIYHQFTTTITLLSRQQGKMHLYWRRKKLSFSLRP